MMRVVGRYTLVGTVTLADLDPAFDEILAALLLDVSVQEPDLSADLDEGILQVEFIVDTNDVWEASQIASSAMKLAFGIAGVGGPQRTRVFAHDDVLPRSPSNLELSLV